MYSQSIKLCRGVVTVVSPIFECRYDVTGWSAKAGHTIRAILYRLLYVRSRACAVSAWWCGYSQDSFGLLPALSGVRCPANHRVSTSHSRSSTLSSVISAAGFDLVAADSSATAASMEAGADLTATAGKVAADPHIVAHQRTSIKPGEAVSAALAATSEGVRDASSPQARAAASSATAAAHAPSASAAVAPSTTAATGITVGDICKDDTQHWQLFIAFRQWARLCHPEGRNASRAALDATPLDVLLPQLRKYIRFIAEANREGGERAGRELRRAALLTTWVHDYLEARGELPEQIWAKQAAAVAGSSVAGAGSAGGHGGVVAAAAGLEAASVDTSAAGGALGVFSGPAASAVATTVGDEVGGAHTLGGW